MRRQEERRLLRPLLRATRSRCAANDLRQEEDGGSSQGDGEELGRWKKMNAARLVPPNDG